MQRHRRARRNMSARLPFSSGASTSVSAIVSVFSPSSCAADSTRLQTRAGTYGPPTLPRILATPFVPSAPVVPMARTPLPVRPLGRLHSPEDCQQLTL
jgi:hypothetical protein